MGSKMADTKELCIRQYLFSEIFSPQNIYIESILRAMRLLVSDIDVLLWKWPPFLKNGLQNDVYNGII